MLFLLLTRYPSPVSTKEMLEFLYPDPDLEPVFVETGVYKIFASLSHKIGTFRTDQYHRAIGYRLYQEPVRKIDMPEPVRTPVTSAHQSLVTDLVKVLNMKKHAKMDDWEKLAILAMVTGKFVFMQDATKHTGNDVLAMLSANIKVGNQTEAKAFEAFKAGIQP